MIFIDVIVPRCHLKFLDPSEQEEQGSCFGQEPAEVEPGRALDWGGRWTDGQEMGGKGDHRTGTMNQRGCKEGTVARHPEPWPGDHSESVKVTARGKPSESLPPCLLPDRRGTSGRRSRSWSDGLS